MSNAATSFARAVLGTSVNDSADPGIVGEFISNATARASGKTLSTGVAQTIASVSLSAGDWDVSCACGLAGTLTGTAFSIGITSASATLPASSFQGDTRVDTPTLATVASDMSLALGPVRVSLASTTTYYLVAQATFTLGTSTCYGRISARRMR